MVAPRGKGIYTRRADLYPDSDPAAYAKTMECDFIAFYNLAATDDQIRRAQQLGLDTFLYNMPGEWEPDNWRETYSHLAERAARLNLDGFIADIESQEWWAGGSAHLESERLVVAAALAQAAQAFRSIGFTSYPTWPSTQFVMVLNASGVWGSPQLYGILEPGTPAQVRARAKKWRQYFKDVVPSLAGYGRGPQDLSDYLDVFRDERGGIFWQQPTSLDAGGYITPRIGTPSFEIMRSWNVRYRPDFARDFVATVGDRVRRPIPRFFT